MAVLEFESLEDEISSLVVETDGLPSVDRRKKVTKTGEKKEEKEQSNNILGRNINYTSRNVCLLGVLAFMMGAFIKSANQIMVHSNDDNKVSHKSFHTSSLGGIHNVHQPGGAHYAGANSDDEWFLPVSNVGHAIQSVTEANIRNLVGHYMHDEHRSPFASHLFDKPKKELDEIQKKWEEKMEKVRKEWGFWKFQDPSPEKERLLPNFDKVDYRDMKNSNMPSSAWQKDEAYIREFLSEGKALVNRVLEGIYAEYGHPTKKADGSVMTEEEKKERHEKFQVLIREGWNPKAKNNPIGLAYLTKAGWDALVTKLLHAMITNDYFYFVLGGHSSAAGHGNNFLQTQAMQFNHLMEPVFDKLGMKLVSKNMAMGGLGTAHFSMGGGGIYGEADFLWWDSGMTEQAGGSTDLFNKQAILSGERVPIILTTYPNDLSKETNGTAWFGSVLGNIVPPTIDRKQMMTLPWASRGVICPKDQALCREYHSQCWYPRSDYTPTVKQLDKMPGRASWHPPEQFHKWNGRAVSLIILQALEVAFEVWETGLMLVNDSGDDMLPLQESLWHVGDKYKALQEKVRTNPDSDKSQCAVWLKDYPKRICQVAMNGATSWTPRNNNKRLQDIVKPAPNGKTLPPDPPQVYSGIDVIMESFLIPMDEVDAHAIAIATNYPPPDISHNFTDDEPSNNATNNTVPTRRWLREQSHETGQRWSSPSSKRTATITHPVETKKPKDDKEELNSFTEISSMYRELGEDEVVPGLGWDMTFLTTGYCDGSSNSHCGRMASDNCLLYAHNDGRSVIQGDALSGWIVFNLDNMREGLVIARLEWWSTRDVPATRGWTKVNNGESPPYSNSTKRHLDQHKQNQPLSFDPNEHARELKAQPPPLPDDFMFDVAIDGTIVNSMNKDQFMKFAQEVTHNVAFYTLYDDVEMAKKSTEGKAVELGLRIRSTKNPRAAGVGITHIYWA